MVLLTLDRFILEYPHDLVVEQDELAHDFPVIVVVTKEPVFEFQPLSQILEIHGQFIGLCITAHEP